MITAHKFSFILVLMYSGITYLIAITLNQNTHSSIADNTIIVVIDIFYKLEDMYRILIVFSFSLLLIIVVTIRSDYKFFS